MDGDTLRARLRERLDATGKKPIPMAVRIGKGRDYLSDILNGKKDSIASDLLTPLAIELQCDERYLFDASFEQPGRPRRLLSEQDRKHFSTAAAKGVFALAWRKFKNIEIRDVADETGLTPGTVSDIEQGLLEPDAEQLAALAKAFETNPGLLRTNPFDNSDRVARLVSITESLDPGDQSALIDMAEALERRRAG